jgi:hypothetical protein
MKLSKAEHLQKAAKLRKLAEEEPNPAEKRDILRLAKRFDLLAQSKRHPENQPAAQQRAAAEQDKKPDNKAIASIAGAAKS